MNLIITKFFLPTMVTAGTKCLDDQYGILVHVWLWYVLQRIKEPAEL